MDNDNRAKSLVSIIVPVYNVAPYIRECIESIQRQTYQEIEIVVVDDGSEDGSGSICEEIAASDSRIKVISQENAGVVTARSRGIDGSAGDYIMFVDGDDWIEPDMIETLISKGKVEDSDLVTSGVYYQETADKTIERYDEFPEGTYLYEEQLGEILRVMLYDTDHGYVQRFTPWIYNKLYRRDLVEVIYKEVAPNITFAEDSVFLYKYLLQCKSVSIIHQCCYHYRYRKESAMHTVNPHMLTDINKVYLALEADFRKHKAGESLIFQLQRWVMIMSCRAINSHMGFCNQAHVPEYIADTAGLRNKKLILYGAGKVGQDTYNQLRRFSYQIILWADRNYQFYQEKGFPVSSPDEISVKDYDVVLIAVGEEDLAKAIEKDLSARGIPGNNMIWNKPMRIFE